MTKISRHQERIWALQILYSLDLTEELNKESAVRRISGLKEEKVLLGDSYYFEKLVYGVIDNKEELDQEIKKKAIDWSIDRIGYIERNILRIAFHEIQQEIPIGVAINEAVEIAKEYADEKSAGFINGILADNEE